jgi:hypothetical protein
MTVVGTDFNGSYTKTLKIATFSWRAFLAVAAISSYTFEKK